MPPFGSAKTGSATSLETFAEIAQVGADQRRAQQLLRASQKLGAATLGTLARQALKRALAGGVGNFPTHPFFNDTERRRLAKAFAAVTATAELLGRARIRRLQEQANEAGDVAKHAEDKPYRVRLVNATAIRNRSLDDQEFGLWGTHYDYDFIPEGELWISDATDPIDRKYFQINAEHERRAIKAGQTLDEAYDVGLTAERSERTRRTFGGGGNRPRHEEVPEGIYDRLWKTINVHGERVEVWLVNGRTVRETAKTDFFSGGHAYVYPFIPEHEVWIEKDKRPFERAMSLIHESTERALMKHEEYGYDDAHEHAARAEFAARQQAKKKHQSFAEEADFTCFAETSLQPLAPRQAVAYFRRLVPQLNVDPELFGLAHERDAFTLVHATEQQLLEKIQDVIADVLRTGQAVSDAPRDIDRILADAGVHPRNPQYGEMVLRTNMMDALNTGTVKELQDPEVAADFPVWRYMGIDDGRQGHDHEPHFGKFFPSAVSFNAVRDSLVVRHGEVVPSGGKGRPFNCRCSPQPIHKTRWAELQREGAKVEAGWPKGGTVDVFAERSKYDEWITIGGREKDDKKHVGGSHVLVDDQGQIKGGPRALVGKKLGKKKPGGTAPAVKPPAPAPQPPPPAPEPAPPPKPPPAPKPVKPPKERKAQKPRRLELPGWWGSKREDHDKNYDKTARFLKSWQAGNEKLKAIQQIAQEGDAYKRAAEAKERIDKRMRERIAMGRNRPAVDHELAAASEEYQKSSKEADQQREKAWNALKLEKPGTMNLKAAGGTTKNQLTKEASEGAKWIEERFAGSVNAYLHVDKDIRAYAAGNYIHIAKDDSTRVIIHELGHVIETQNEQVRLAANAFLHGRTRGAELELLKRLLPSSGYDQTEESYGPDNWEKAFGYKRACYIGKTYPANCTEVVSMGIEQMYRDPIGFAHNDPEYFKLIAAILDGSIS